MKKFNEKNKRIILYLLSFLIPFIILFGIVIYLKVYPFGDAVYLPVDVHEQYEFFLEYFRDALLGKNSIFYSLSKSIGGEMFGTFAYYMASPFNIILLLFKKSDIDIAYVTILLLKTAFAGLSSFYLLSRNDKCKFSNLIFSTSYALSAYLITYGINIMWIDGVILLPIIIAGLDDLINKDKAILYTISLALALITNYYIGFMICIFLVIYLAYKIILQRKEYKGRILKIFTKFAIYSIFAALIACIILVPAYIGLKDGRAEFDSFQFDTNMNFKMQNMISKFFTCGFNILEITNIGMPPLYCGIIINVLVLMFFFNKKINIEEKLITILFFIIFILSFYYEKINILWTLGNYPAFFEYRYAFAFILMYILIAKKSFDNIREGLSTPRVIIPLVIILITMLIISHFKLGVINKVGMIIDVVSIITFGITLLICEIGYKESKNKLQNNVLIIIIFIINTIGLIINSAYCMQILQNRDGFSFSDLNNEDGEKIIEYNEREFDKLKEMDNSLYRVDSKYKVSNNEGLAYNFHGIGFAASTFSRSTYKFLKAFGYTVEHVTVALDIGNTKASDMFFGIKYMTNSEEGVNPSEYERQEIDDKYTVYKNPYALNLGFKVSKNILNNVQIVDNAFEYQNSIIKSASGLDKDIFTSHQGAINESTFNICKNQQYYLRENNEEEGILSYEFEIEKPQNAYLYLLGYKLQDLEIYINGEQVPYRRYGGYNRMIPFGKHEVGEKIKVDFKISDGNFILNSKYLYYEDDAILKEHYDILSQNQVDLQEMKGNKLEGNIKTEQDNELILFTIPYDNGSRVYVDGKKVDMIKLQDELIGINIEEEGEHKIEFVFMPEGFILGLAISIFGIILFIICEGKTILTYFKR